MAITAAVGRGVVSCEIAFSDEMREVLMGWLYGAVAEHGLDVFGSDVTETMYECESLNVLFTYSGWSLFCYFSSVIQILMGE